MCSRDHWSIFVLDVEFNWEGFRIYIAFLGIDANSWAAVSRIMTHGGPWVVKLASPFHGPLVFKVFRFFSTSISDSPYHSSYFRACGDVRNSSPTPSVISVLSADIQPLENHDMGGARLLAIGARFGMHGVSMGPRDLTNPGSFEEYIELRRNGLTPNNHHVCREIYALRWNLTSQLSDSQHWLWYQFV